MSTKRVCRKHRIPVIPLKLNQDILNLFYFFKFDSNYYKSVVQLIVYRSEYLPNILMPTIRNIEANSFEGECFRYSHPLTSRNVNINNSDFDKLILKCKMSNSCRRGGIEQYMFVFTTYPTLSQKEENKVCCQVCRKMQFCKCSSEINGCYYTMF